MDIRIVSSLTAEDEAQLAPAVLTAVVSLLTGLPVSYAVRIETTTGVVVQHTNLPPAGTGEAAADPAARAAPPHAPAPVRS